jgi:hypothetical protein
MPKIKKNPRDSSLNKTLPYVIRATFVVTLVVAAVLVGMRTVGFLRAWIEDNIRTTLFTRLQSSEKRVDALTESSSPVVPPPAESKDIFADFTQSSFSDLFSGVGWLDETQTDLYQDKRLTAFVLPPVIVPQKIASYQPPAAGWPERGAAGEYSRCLGGRCLTEQNSRLSFQGTSLALPAEVSGKEVTKVSIGSLDTKWLVGVVAKGETRYEGWVFSFDGIRFRKIFGGDGVFSSSYAGTLGFGGSDDDWLAVYGGYEGIAYRVRGGIPSDISRFFGIRAMNGGFEPAVLRAGTPPTWYVFSLTPGNPQFLKLFQNGTNEVQGAVDLFPLVGPLQGSSLATFGIQKVGDGVISLVAKVTGDGEDWWQIDDRGFKKDRSYAVVSSNINNYTSRVVYVRIETSDLKEQGAAASFSVSGDDRVWHAVQPREAYRFSPMSKELYWRAVFLPDSDPLSSPYFDGITLKYWLGS